MGGARQHPTNAIKFAADRRLLFERDCLLNIFRRLSNVLNRTFAHAGAIVFLLNIVARFV
jgi:hypothetical protein